MRTHDETYADYVYNIHLRNIARTQLAACPTPRAAERCAMRGIVPYRHAVLRATRSRTHMPQKRRTEREHMHDIVHTECTESLCDTLSLAERDAMYSTFRATAVP